MTRLRAWTAAALWAAACAAGCGGPAPAPSPGPPGPSAAAPTLVAEPASFDFGRVLPDRALHKEFRLRNLGRHAVAIESVSTDCGCMVVGDYARRLEAGASTTLKVLLQTPTQPGELARSLVVKASGASPATLELRVRATVVAEGAGGAGS